MAGRTGWRLPVRGRAVRNRSISTRLTEGSASSTCPGTGSRKFPKEIASEWKELIEQYLLGAGIA